jgi:hypothetical protein
VGDGDENGGLGYDLDKTQITKINDQEYLIKVIDGDKTHEIRVN